MLKLSYLLVKKYNFIEDISSGSLIDYLYTDKLLPNEMVLLKVMFIIECYLRVSEGDDIQPRIFIIGYTNLHCNPEFDDFLQKLQKKLKTKTEGKLALYAFNVDKEVDQALYDASDFNSKMMEEFENKGEKLEDVPLKVGDALTNLKEYKYYKAV